LALFCTVGFINAFGVFQQYYKANMLKDKSESDVSWLGSVCMFFLYLLAPVAGILVDRIGPTVSLPLTCIVTASLICVLMTPSGSSSAEVLGCSFPYS